MLKAATASRSLIKGPWSIFCIILCVLNPLHRFREVPTFGRDTIRKFVHNASGMKKLAARDFEDLLQVCWTNCCPSRILTIFSAQFPFSMVYLTLVTTQLSWTSSSNSRHGIDSLNFAFTPNQLSVPLRTQPPD
jgi:hypothetical protein